MDESINEIQIVINTLDGGLNIPTTYENCVKLAGCIDFLVKARDRLKALNEKMKGEHANDGNG